MDTKRVPGALRDRLGSEATAGLVDLINEAGAEWKADVIALSGERFERRLAEELGKLRVEMAQGFAALRQELVERLADQRTELLKWAFLFWVGQFFAMAGLVAVLVRAMRPGA